MNDNSKIITVSSSNTLDLDQPGNIWRVETGMVDIFTVCYVNGEPSSSRIHLFRLEPGDFIFPLKTVEHKNGELHFFGKGDIETAVTQISGTELASFIDHDPDAAAVSIDRWLFRLLQVVNSGKKPEAKYLRRAKREEKGFLKSGAQVTSARGVVWLSIGEGRVAYGGREDFGSFAKGAYIPLIQGVYIDIIKDTDLSSFSTYDYITTHHSFPDTVTVTELFLKSVSIAVDDIEAENRRLFTQRKDEDSKVFKSSLKTLSTTINIQPVDSSANLKWRPPLKLEYLFWAGLTFLLLLCVAWFGKLIHITSLDWKMRRQAAVYRSETLKEYRGPIRIGIAAPRRTDHDKTLWNGIELATMEVNNSGGVIGRQLELVLRDDGGQIGRARKVAQEFADDMTMSAVLGHRFSFVSLATAMIYEYYGLLMICPRTTSPKLTSQGYRRVFRTNLSGTTYGIQMADFANKMGYKKVVILYINDAFGKGVANAFEIRADELDIAIVDRVPHSRSITLKGMHNKMETWKENREFDALILVSVMAYGPKFIKIARESGINKPMILHEALDSDDIVERVGIDNCSNIYIASMFHPDSSYPKVKPFTDAYLKKYKELPNGLAAQGYDAIYILADAIKKAESAVPDDIAEELRKFKNWYGVTGPHTFTDEGEMKKPLQFKMIKNGILEHIPWQRNNK